MKKKILSLVLSGAMIMSMVACGEVKSLADVDMNKYLQLGDYTGLEIETPAAYVNESTIEADMQSIIENNGDKTGLREGVCKNGDIINIDFAGFAGDVQFEGGTAADQTFTLGTGKFIPGFEEQIVGMEVGEVRDIEVTFPDNYAPELAGTDAIFKITLNYIIPDVNDASVAALGSDKYSNVKELHDFLYDMYFEEAQENAKKEAVGRAVYQIVSNSVFKEVPENILEEQKQTLRAQLQPYCEARGVDVDEYAQVVYGATIDQLSEKYVKQRMVCMAIAKEQKLEVSDATVNSTLESSASNMGITVEEYLEQQAVSFDYLKEYMTSQLVYDYLYDNNTFIIIGE